MSPEPGVLGRLAASVADGTPVDWSHIESDIAPRERRLVPHLRLVESIASLYRSIPALDETAPDIVPSGPRWGRLVMLERIGQGMSCEVYRAFDTDLHRHVALKLLHEEGQAARAAHDRILQEARRLARVRHPHVVQVLGAEQHNDRVGLWMELVEGESLDRIVRARGTFGAREGSVIGQDICSALASVHAAGLLHRDVKAQNVMREAGGRIVLMDFGTGEELFRDRGTARIVGTPLYLAPEILDGKSASIQSDLYSVGVLLFYLVTGEFPVTASNDRAAGRRAPAASAPSFARRTSGPAIFVRSGHRSGARARARSPIPERGGNGGCASGSAERLSAPRAGRGGQAAGFELAPCCVGVAGGDAGCCRWVDCVAEVLHSTGGAHGKLHSNCGPADEGPFVFSHAVPRRRAHRSTHRDAGPDSVAARDRVLDQQRNSRIRQPLTTRSRSSLASTRLCETSVTSEQTSPDALLRARVDTRVVKAGVAAPVWTGSVEWVAGDSHALQAGLTPRDRQGSQRCRHVRQKRVGSTRQAQTNPNAEEAYLRGRAELLSYGPEAARRALEAFQRAVVLRPKHAGALRRCSPVPTWFSGSLE